MRKATDGMPGCLRVRSNPTDRGASDNYGTPGWDRTSGFQLRRLTLYPLSYGRIGVNQRSESENRAPITWNLVQMKGQVKLKSVTRFKGSSFRILRFGAFVDFYFHLVGFGELLKNDPLRE